MRNGSWRASWLAPRLRRSFTPAPSEAGMDGITRSSLRIVIVFILSSCREAGLRGEALGPSFGCGKTVIAALGRDCKALGVHELDVGDADEAEELAHELALRMGIPVESATRGEHV